MIAAKRYVLECYGQTRRLDPPLWAVFDIALETAQAILSLSALVRDRGLSAIGKADTRVFYFGPDPLAVYKDGRATGLRLDPRLLRPRRDDENVLAANAQRLWVASYSFGFLAFTLSGSHEFNFTTETCSIAELAAYFDLPWDFGGPPQYLQAKFGEDGEDPKFPRSDWNYEVANGDTKLGYYDWLWHRHEAEGAATQSWTFGQNEPVAHYVQAFRQKGLAESSLDAIVNNLKGDKASTINIAGLAAQIRYILAAERREALNSILGAQSPKAAPIDHKALSEARHAAANREWESFQFGAAKVADACGWEFFTPGNSWTRLIFLAPIEERDAPTDRGRFTVAFGEKSADLIEAYAVNCDGQRIGRRSPAPAF